MKIISLLFLVFILGVMRLNADDFPKFTYDYAKYMKEVTQEKYPGSESVILYKEYYSNKKFSSNSAVVNGQYFSFDERIGETQREIKIIKVLTNIGVSENSSIKLGSYYNSGMKHSLKVKVIKSDLTMFEYGDEIIHISDSKGRNKDRIILYTAIIPNIEVNDVIHIEKFVSFPNGIQIDRIYELSEVDPVLHAKLWIRASDRYSAALQMFPQNAGTFSKQQLPNGEIELMVDARNLPGIKRAEMYLQPYQDLFYIACTSFHGVGSMSFNITWNSLASNFNRTYVQGRFFEPNELSDEMRQRLKFKLADELKRRNEEDKKISGFIEENFKGKSQVTPQEIYQVLRNRYVIIGESSKSWRSKTEDLLKSTMATPTDLVFLFTRIADNYKIKHAIAFLRDKRQGIWEDKYISLEWFDRVLAVAYVDDKPVYFDFTQDADFSGNTLPWYTQGVRVVLYDYAHAKIAVTPFSNENQLKYTYTYKLAKPQNIDITEELEGSFYDNMRTTLKRSDKKYWMNYLLRFLKMKYLSKKVEIRKIEQGKDSAIVNYSINNKYYSEADNKIFISFSAPFIETMLKNFIEKERYYDIYFETPKKYVFTFEVEFDKKYQPMQIPQSYSFTAIPDFNIAVSTELKESKLITTYTLQHTKSTFSYKQYGQMRNAIREAYAVLTRDIVFKKL